jgi:molecular chaperone HscA
MPRNIHTNTPITNAMLQIYEPGQTPLPHADVVAVGIDLGTTHSVVAIATEGAPQAIADASGNEIVPSVVWYEGAHATVGTEAKRANSEGEGDTVRSIKRLMGKSAADIPTLAGEVPYALDVSAEGMARIQLMHRSITPTEISADILRHLKHMAEDALGKDVTKAVITVPAYFDDAARTATKDAAKLAGLEVLRLLNEPTAAALAYGLDQQAKGVFVVYDLGGGTFDVSILKLQEGVFQVIATAGDTMLGGDDMDSALAECVMRKLNIHTLDAVQRQTLLAACRVGKEALSSAETASVQWEGTRIEISRARFEPLIAPLVARTIACCERALADAGLTREEITGVVMVGGATRVPLVKQEVAAFFGTKLHDSLDPDKIVALGAALQAEALTKGSDTLLLDVLPLSLGLETMGGIVEKILHRNTPIPVTMAQEFTTYQDGQTAIALHIVQGEREKAEHCRSLARFTLRGIPPMVAGAARVQVQFSVDADGLLTVAAREQTTGEVQQIEIKPTYGISVEEMADMLRASMEHAKTDILERLLIEARVEAERNMLEITAAMHATPHLLKPGEAEMFAAQLDTLRQAVAGSDRERIDYEVQQLSHLVGGFAERRMNAAIAEALAGKHIEAV